MEDKKNQSNQLNIEVPEDVASGVYSNFVIVAHSPAEFVLDYVQILPGMPKAVVKSRIIMTPQHAKRLYHALEENIQKFEAAFGKLELKDGHQGSFPPPFGGPAGIA